MAPLFTGLKFGFGRAEVAGPSGPSGQIINISPALPGGRTTWDFGTDGNLVINEYSTRSFEFASPFTKYVSVFGGGSGSYVSPQPAVGAGSALYLLLGGSGGAIRAQVNFTSGTTYWIHVGEGALNTGVYGAVYAGGGASALTLAPSSTGTEILVAGGGGGNGNYFLGPGPGPFTSPYSHGSGANTGLPGTIPGPPSSGTPGSGTTGGAAGATNRSSNAQPGGNAPRGKGGNSGYTSGSSGQYADGGRSGYAAGGSTSNTPGDGPGSAGGGGYAGGGGTNTSSGSLGSGGAGNGYHNPSYVVVPTVTAVSGLSVFIGPNTYPIPADAFTNPTPVNTLGSFPTNYGAGGGGDSVGTYGRTGAPGAFIIEA